MTDKHKDIWDQIEEQRASYALAIGKATDTINAARKLIAEAREGMDALPVAKVRRPRKATLSEEMGAQSMGYGAGVGAVDDPAWSDAKPTRKGDNVSAEAVTLEEVIGFDPKKVDAS